MEFIKWANPILCIVEAMVGIVAILLIMAFAKIPTDTAMLTNALITVLILVELFIASILLKTYDKGGKRR